MKKIFRNCDWLALKVRLGRRCHNPVQQKDLCPEDSLQSCCQLRWISVREWGKVPLPPGRNSFSWLNERYEG